MVQRKRKARSGFRGACRVWPRRRFHLEGQRLETRRLLASDAAELSIALGDRQDELDYDDLPGFFSNLPSPLSAWDGLTAEGEGSGTGTGTGWGSGSGSGNGTGPGSGMGCQGAESVAIDPISDFDEGTYFANGSGSGFRITGTISPELDFLNVEVNGNAIPLSNWSNGAWETYPLSVSDDNPTGTASDLYTVTATAMHLGCMVTATETFTIFNLDPTVSVTGPSGNVYEGASTAFMFTLDDPGPDYFPTVDLDWGDGQSETFSASKGQHTRYHTYADDTGGPFTITAIAADDDTGNATNSASITVLNVPPTVNAGPDQTVNEGDTVSLSGSFTDPGAVDTHTFLWEVTSTNGQAIANGGGPTFSFTPHDNGVYTATFTVIDDDGGVGSDSVTITVNNVAPQDVDAGDNQTVSEGDTVSLSGAFTDPGSADTHTFSWQVSASNGDAISDGTGQSFSFVARDNGIYVVTFTVSDDDGGQSSDTVYVSANNVAPSITSLTQNATAIDEGQSVAIQGAIFDPGVLDTQTVTIHWGDGQTTQLSLAAGATAIPETLHTYSDDGPSPGNGTTSDTYPITVTVVDKDGGSAGGGLSVAVNNVAPTISISGSDINEGQTQSIGVNIADPGSSDLFTITVAWDDGTTEVRYNQSGGAHTFTRFYDDDDPTDMPSDAKAVQVTVEDDDTGNGSASHTFQVNNVNPSVTVSGPASITENSSAGFMFVLSDPGTDELNVVVNWGDGTSESFGGGPGSYLLSHLYLDDNPSGTSQDTYAITAFVTDDDTGTATGSGAITVNNVAPTFSLDPIANIDEGGALTIGGVVHDPGIEDEITVTIEVDINFDGDFQDEGETVALALSPNGSQDRGLSHSISLVPDDGATYDAAGNRAWGNGAPFDALPITVTVNDDDLGSSVANVGPEVRNVAPQFSSNPSVQFEFDSNNKLVSATVSGGFIDPGMVDFHQVSITWGDGGAGDGTTNPVPLPLGDRSFSITRLFEPPSAIDLFALYPIGIMLEDDDSGSIQIVIHGAKADLDTDSNNDGTIDGDNAPDMGTDDPIEENLPGRLVLLNDDDDNANGVIDFDDTGSAAEDDLAEVQLSVDASSGASPEVRLDFSGPIKVWTSTAKVQQITSGQNWTTGSPPSSVFVEGIGLGVAELILTATDDPHGSASDKVKLTVVTRLDIDIDSDNSGAIDGDEPEDAIEANNPGKRLPANTIDSDGDLIPGYADGFDLDGAIVDDDIAGASFTPVSIAIPAWVDSASAQLTFIYNVSDPSAAEGAALDYPRPAGLIRIWTKDGNVARNKQAIVFGDFVGAASYALADLDLAPGDSGIFYVEGINAGAGTIKVSLDAGSSFSSALDHDDFVALTVVDLDLDVDSDNVGGFSRNDQEDRIEDELGFPGKYVAINKQDVDGDGVEDFADWSIAGSAFTPLELELPASTDLNSVKIKVDYSASDPNLVAQDAAGAWVAAAGALRIWKKNAGAARNPQTVLAGGDYLAPGEYTAAQLGLVAGATATLYMEGIAQSDAWGDRRILFELDPGGSSSGSSYISQDAVRVTVDEVDLDLDSNNNDGLGNPARSPWEDQVENDADKPGKYVTINNADLDNDRVPDFADMLIAGALFTPIIVEVSSSVDLAYARFTVAYNLASNPLAVTVDPVTGAHLPDPGAVRVWMKDAWQLRNPNPANAAGGAGDFVAPGVYTAAQLGLTPNDREVTLFVEGISPAVIQITIESDPDGEGPVDASAEDTVKVTIVEIDADVDSDNNQGSDIPERTLAEDQVEDVRLDPQLPGKYLLVNNRDTDEDGLPDFADGFGAIPGANYSLSTPDQNARFTPLVIAIPEPVSLADAKIRITYSDSDPAGLVFLSGVPVAAPGHLRLWKLDGDLPRNPASTLVGGDYIPPGEYTFTQLGGDLQCNDRTLTLYIEAITVPPATVPGPDNLGNLLGQSRIQVELDPDGDGYASGSGSGTPSTPYGSADYMAHDAVQVMIVHEVTVSAPNAYAAEKSITGSGNDPGRFIFSRGEGNTEGDLRVYYQIDTTLPGVAFATPGDDYSSPANYDPATRIGFVTIPHGWSTVSLDILPTDDSAIEWDETVQLHLLPNQEYLSSSTPTTPWYFLSELDPTDAALTILDDEEIGGLLSRNIDEQCQCTPYPNVSNGRVQVGIEDGDVAVVYPLDTHGAAPSYRSDDNLHPLLAVEMQVPEAPIASIVATLTLGGVASSPVLFDGEGLTAGATYRFVVSGDANLADKLRTGHYEYDVEFVLMTSSGIRTRTIRGGTEVINLVDEELGTPEFGKRWWLNGLDRLAFSDGVSPVRDANDPQTLPATSRLTTKGAAAASGTALVRGDSTSGWFAGAPAAPVAVKDDSDLGQPAGWVEGDGQFGYAAGYLFTTAGMHGEDTSVSWTISGLDSTRPYQVFVTWTPDASRASNVPFTVSGAREVGSSNPNKTMLIDQRYAPGETALNDAAWRSLGFFLPNSGQINVSVGTYSVAGYADGAVVADAVAVVDDWSFSTPAGSFDTLETVSGPNRFQLADRYSGKSNFNGVGLLQSHQSAAGNTATYSYTDADGDGRADELLEVGCQCSGAAVYSYDTAGYLDAVAYKTTETAGRTTEFTVNGGLVTQVIMPDPGGDAEQPSVSFAYGGPDNLLSSVAIAGEDAPTVVAYNHFRAASITNPDGVPWSINPFLLNGLGVVHSPATGGIGALAPTSGLAEPKATVTNELGKTWLYQADDFGLLTSQAKPITTDNPQADVWQWIRNALGFVENVLQPPPDGSFLQGGGGGEGEGGSSPLSTQYGYDAHGHVATAAYPDGTGESWTYDPTFGLPTSHIDHRGKQTLYTLDPSTGWVLFERRVVGQNDQTSGETDDLVFSYTYTSPPATQSDLPGGLLATMTDPLGRTTNYDYNARGLVERITYAVGTADEAFIEFEYDEHNNLTAEIDELGRRTEHQYDGLDRRIKTILPDPDGASGPLTAPEYRYKYDVLSRMVQETDPLARVTNYTYDTMGRLLTLTRPDHDGDGNPSVWSYTYDHAGSLLTETDPFDRTTVNTYDGRGRLETKTLPDPDGAGPLLAPVYIYKYDSLGRLLSQTDPLGNTTDYQHDALGRVRVILQADPDGASGPAGRPQTVFDYDDAGNLISTTDAMGNETTHEYDDLGRRVKTILPDPDGTGPLASPSVDYGYDKAGNLRFTTDPLTNVTERQYDARDRLTKILQPDPDGLGPLTVPITKYGYDDAGQLLSAIDALGNATTYAYDNLGRLTQVTLPDPDNAGPQTSPVYSSTYDAVGNLLTETDALSRVTAYEYDAHDNMAEVTLPDPDGTGALASPVYAYSYDDVGKVLTMTDPLGNVIAYGYDDLDRRTSITYADPDGAGPLTSPVDAFAYDAMSNLTQFTDPLGRVTSYDYDHLHRRTSVTLPDPDGAGPLASPVTTYSYDTAGRLESETDPLGDVTAYEYDGLNRLIETTLADPDGAGPLSSPVYGYTYDSAGNLLTETDPLTRVTTYEYDNLNRQTKITLSDPDGAGAQLSPFTISGYDLVGNLLFEENALGHRTSYGYDNLYRLTSETDPNGDAVTFAYDAVGNRTSLTDPEDTTTTWVYDGLNRVTEETNELNDTRYFVYDAASNLLRKTDRNGRVTEFDHDHLHRLTAERWLDGSGNTIRTLSFSYDAADQLLAASDPAASYTYAYDNLGRRTAVTHDLAGLSFDVEMISAFNAAGNRTQLKAIVDGVTEFTNDYGYDALHRMTSVAQQGESGGHAVAEKRADFTYDAASHWDTISRYEDVTAASSHVATSTYFFDAAGRLTGLTHAQGATTLADYDWSFDRASRVTQFISLVDGTVDYAYDARGQLTGADSDYQADEAYTYDDNGNRTNTGYSTGANNRLLSDGIYNYAYDAEGNQIEQTNISTGVMTKYEWDHRNRLVKITERPSASDPATQVIDYVYDLWGRRLSKHIDEDADGDYDSESLYIYDGERYERGNAGDHIAMAFNGDGDLTNRYLHGPAVEQILADEQLDDVLGTTAPGEVLWPLTDSLNTVRDLAIHDAATDAANIVNHLTYDVYGNITAETDPTVIHIYAFAGRERDYESSLYYYRARYYAATTGVFIAEDPIGFAAGQANLRAYVDNRPTQFVDPSGLEGYNGQAGPAMNGSRFEPYDMLGYPSLEQYNARTPQITLDEALAQRRWEDLKLQSARNAGEIRPASGSFEHRLMLAEEERRMLDQMVANGQMSPWTHMVAGLNPASASPLAMQNGFDVAGCFAGNAAVGPKKAPHQMHARKNDLSRTSKSPYNPYKQAWKEQNSADRRARNGRLLPAPTNAPTRTSSRPEWLRRLDEGNAFNRSQAHRYPHNEVYVNKPSGSGYYRVDSYNPRSGEIVSRKFTQFSDIQESTGIGYVNEFTRKYSPGTTIADVPSSGSLAGQRLQGQMILEVPVQTRPIPQGVLDAANDAGVIIRDINGRIY